MGFLDFMRQPAPAAIRRNITLTDYAFWMNLQGGSSAAGESVNEHSSMGLTAVHRSVQLIAGTIGSLPLHTYRTAADGSRVRTSSYLDDPGAPVGLTRYEWVETLVAHLLLHGNAFGLVIENQAGTVAGIQLIHPSLVSVELDTSRPGGRRFRVQVAGQTVEYTEESILHFRGLSTDGVLGYSPIQACRNAIGSGIAADKAAARMYSNGLLLGGVMSLPEDYDEDQAAEVQASLQNRLGGAGKAGDIAVINAAVDFKPWTMNASDAQFIESRGFQVEEVARLFGVPKVLLAEDGASTWGSGIGELIRGFQKFTLAPLTTRIEQVLARSLGGTTFVEFDYAGLLQPDHSQVIQNMDAEIRAGLLTVDEGRRILNRPALASAPATTDNEEVSQ